MRKSPFAAGLEVLSAIERAGFEAYFVGGCVRDHLLGADPDQIQEFDVATRASSQEVTRLFRGTVLVGQAFGIVRVPRSGHWFEVATYRGAVGPRADRSGSIDEDSLHRDFTINAIYWNPDRQALHDPHDGRTDLDRRIVRAVGDPRERFQEDPLRVLRAVRFGTMGSFRIDPGTEASLSDFVPGLMQTAAERRLSELQKLTEREGQRRGDAWTLLQEHRVLRALLPSEFDPIHDPEAPAILNRLRERRLALWLAVALRTRVRVDAPSPLQQDLAEKALAHLRGSNDDVELLAALLRDRKRYRRLHNASLSRLRLLATRTDARSHEELIRAEGGFEPMLEMLESARLRFGATRPKPLLDGNQLIQLGFRPGRTIGLVLRRARILQLRGVLNTVEDATNWAYSRRNRTG